MEYKLNFDAAIFSGLEKLGIDAIIRNDKGEVMAGMSAIGPKVIQVKRLSFLRVGDQLSLLWILVLLD